MYCKYCGKEIKDDSTKCEFCGRELESEKIKDLSEIWHKVVIASMCLLAGLSIIGNFLGDWASIDFERHPLGSIFIILFNICFGLFCAYVAYDLFLDNKSAPKLLYLAIVIGFLNTLLIQPIIMGIAWGINLRYSFAVSIADDFFSLIILIVLWEYVRKYYETYSKRFINGKDFEYNISAVSLIEKIKGKAMTSQAKKPKVKPDRDKAVVIEPPKTRIICQKCGSNIYIKALECPNCGSTDIKEEIVIEEETMKT